MAPSAAAYSTLHTFCGNFNMARICGMGMIYHTLDLTQEEIQLLRDLCRDAMTRREPCEILDNLYNTLQRIDKYA
jgi:hypothetical protein